MTIRLFKEEDKPEVIALHQKHFAEEFPLPDFDEMFNLHKYVVTENDKVVLFGGIRYLAEAIAISDKDQSRRVRYEALLKLLQACLWGAATSKFNQIHCTIQDPQYMKILQRYGFSTCKGTFLYHNL